MSSVSLTKRRGGVKAKLTSFQKFVTNLETLYPNKVIDENTFLELEQRLERAQKLIDEFDDIQIQIHEITENEEQEQIERETFETAYFETLTKAKSYIITHSTPMEMPVSGAGSIKSSTKPSPPNSVASGGNPNSNIQGVKLPTIQLMKYFGEFDKWLEFRDTYSSLIHKNDSLTDIQKFHYLRASLGGSALQIIANLEFSSANYSVAWDLICKRYNNNKILTQNHVKALFNLDKIHEESSRALRKIVEEVATHLRALEILEEPTSNWDTLIIHLMSTKLDSTTAREWEEAKASLTTKPTLENLNDFLKKRVDLLESLEGSKSNKRFIKNKLEASDRTKSFVTSKAYCVFCKGSHYIQECSDFVRLSVKDRIDKIKEIKLCINCLRPGHVVKMCRSSSCKFCKSRHNSLLHLDSKLSKNEPPDKNEEVKVESINLSSQHISQNSQVLLSTVLVRVLDKHNKPHLARALLDVGSQSSFMTAEFCRELQLNHTNVDIKVGGLNQTHAEINQRVLAHLQSQINSFSIRVSCLIVPQITNELPNFKVDLPSLQIPDHIKLADPNFHIPDKIDLLLGADCFWEITCVGQIKLGQHGPVLQKTKFGWIVSGPLTSNGPQTVSCNFSRNSEIDKQFTRFWEIEEFSNVKPLSNEEKLCESHFLHTTQRDSHGRFIVTMPMKDSPNKLGDSYETAKKRLLSLERKFESEPDFKAKYSEFIHEYLDLGHMCKVPETDNSEFTYYMPHHGVFKESSLTTKLRVVFDASCPSSTGYSSNDLQMVGPTIQPDIFSALVRHRKYNYVVAGDVEKMYRMCLVSPNQTPLQRILWRDNPSDPIDVYELKTVTYGTSSASYLAIRCLYQLGVECSFPDIADVIKNHFYVDDMLTGGSTVQEVISIANEVIRVLERGCFKLRKFVSNSPEVLHGVNVHNETNSVDFGINENTKTLGMIWNGHSDCLLYKINDANFSKHVTKRTILSEVSQIFDPLGLLSPCIILAKIILQRLWCEKVTWDETVSSSLHTKWLQFRDELVCLNQIKIARQITCKNPILVEIHGFSDASTHAYGACVYAKSQNQNGESFVKLICAKSKVAPLKTQTIPRLELTAALLLARLVEKTKTSLGMLTRRTTYWCDSTIVLGWLNMQPHLLQTFVANRIVVIQESSDVNEWRHVPTDDNPADYVSRGVNPSALESLDMYWNGPTWLRENESSWPVWHTSLFELPELRKQVNVCETTMNCPVISFKDYSNLTRLERIVAYCLRFKSNCSTKIKSRRSVGSLTSREIENANLALARISQRECFSKEIACLNNGKEVSLKSKLSRLNPFSDENSVLRVGGRLSNSAYDFNKRHPIVISSKHHFAELLFSREHARLLHAGPQLLLSSIRDKFWPLAGRNLARKIVHKCLRCFKVKPRTITPIMGNLPNERVKPSPPFYVTGVDYAGPFMVKDRRGRGCKVTKCYISLFVCFSTRAVHLELVSDLTMEAFLAALRRFTARRGKPSQMFSDNGSNFVSAKTELCKLGKFLKQNTKSLTESIESDGISWSFIPTYSPHFGGLWEAGIKSTKHHLRRVAGNAILTFEQFYTLLVQIEAVLNSRPMSPLSSDPSDFSPLTPSHFLIGRKLTSVADPDVTQIPQSRLSHFQHVQRLQQHFWTRWSREYISELQQRSKWLRQQGHLKTNDLIVIKEANLPPLKWSLGRIVNVHPGKDGVARVATIRTPSGVTIKRSFARICPLPVDTECSAKAE